MIQLQPQNSEELVLAHHPDFAALRIEASGRNDSFEITEAMLGW
jgi:hypothetical protein